MVKNEQETGDRRSSSTPTVQNLVRMSHEITKTTITHGTHALLRKCRIASTLTQTVVWSRLAARSGGHPGESGPSYQARNERSIVAATALSGSRTACPPVGVAAAGPGYAVGRYSSSSRARRNRSGRKSESHGRLH